jgi:cytochrome b561
MSDIVQHITTLLQQVHAWFPWIPSSMLLFFAILSTFLILALALALLRLLWAVGSLPWRRRARKSDPRWQRQARLRALRQQHHWQRWNDR